MVGGRVRLTVSAFGARASGFPTVCRSVQGGRRRPGRPVRGGAFPRSGFHSRGLRPRPGESRPARGAGRGQGPDRPGAGGIAGAGPNGAGPDRDRATSDRKSPAPRDRLAPSPCARTRGYGRGACSPGWNRGRPWPALRPRLPQSHGDVRQRAFSRGCDGSLLAGGLGAPRGAGTSWSTCCATAPRCLLRSRGPVRAVIRWSAPCADHPWRTRTAFAAAARVATRTTVTGDHTAVFGRSCG
jgi:hypothetical protein